ncbi:MAG: DnaJ domain-containing protein [Caulobacteraceae bacterium]
MTWLVLALAALAVLVHVGRRGRPIRLRWPGAPVSVELSEARAILGVGPNASPAEIEAAYRRLMLRAHPDTGGTAGLAAKLNAARDRLINNI